MLLKCNYGNLPFNAVLFCCAQAACTHLYNCVCPKCVREREEEQQRRLSRLGEAGDAIGLQAAPAVVSQQHHAAHTDTTSHHQKLESESESEEELEVEFGFP